MEKSSNHRPLRIAFLYMPSLGKSWTAGTHYLKNLFLALRSLENDLQPEIVLLVAHKAKPDSYQSLSPYIDHVLHTPPPKWRDFWQRQMLRIKQRFAFWPTLEPSLGPHLCKHKVDVIFSRGEFGPRFRLPLLTWIPDFQPLRLPEMFSPADIQNLTKNFAKNANRASRVILSSQDALHDFEQFATEAAHKGRVLSFVAQLPAEIYDSDPAWVCDHYHLPRRFIYLPNQFWKHKNHEMVVEALCIAKAKQPAITVVCTGNTNDYRHPLYFGELWATISAKGLRDNLIILGLVPHQHLFQLMRQSIAVLQPSLFEGWSTTVEECKSVGKTIILSDIPVHREQAPHQAFYFNPKDPEALANCLVNVFNKKEPGPDYELEALAREQLPKRTRKFGQTFVDIVKEIVSI